MKMTQKLITYIAIFTLVTLIGACTDEVENLIERKGDTVVDTLTALPGTRILEYSVENAPEVIYGAINNSTRTITIYLPQQYADFRIIDPVISLPEGTTITPDDDELVPVTTEEPFVYTVSAPEQEDVEYTVITIRQHPKIVLDELSTSEDTTNIIVPSGNAFIITGKNFIPDVSITRVYLIDEDENDYELEFSSNTQRTAVSTRLDLPAILDEELVGRFYWVEMRAYALTVRMKYPIYLEKSD